MPKLQLHLGRFATLPTVEELTRMVTALTGKPPTPEDLAEAQRLRQEAEARWAKAVTPPRP